MVESIFEYGFQFVEIFGSKFLLRVVFDTTDIRISLQNPNIIGKYLCLVVLGDHKSSFHEYGRGENNYDTVPLRMDTDQKTD